ncbi:ABC-type transporter, integral membrane subunit [Desulfovibrio sp. X2]|nr:ABC-type transporter, integral membrane subunit [Desulfovibrio sp. X2]
MNMQQMIFKPGRTESAGPWVVDAAILAGLIGLVGLVGWLALSAPQTVSGPEISLSLSSLPWYAAYSVARMFAAYVLSMLFSMFYGSLAARSRFGEVFMLPVLDVLQSVPILSFLPVVLLGFTAVLPENLAVELASVVLIFTSQAWNITFAWYQSQVTMPKELKEASANFRFNPWLRFRTLDLPFAGVSLIWNSIMSWAGGWFFLMAAEIFTVGHRDFRLPGIGSYLQEAASQGNVRAILWGLGVLVLVIVALDQLVWRPLLAWGERFKLTMVGSEEEPTSWVYDLLQGSNLLWAFHERVLVPAMEWIDMFIQNRVRPFDGRVEERAPLTWRSRLFMAVAGVFAVIVAAQALRLLGHLPSARWADIAVGLLATFLRVMAALAVAMLWTVPLGVAIGSNPRLASFLQPMVQIAASVPATAIFPVALMFLVGLTGGLNLAAVLLMLMGTQWYMLFNVIAGASTIPQDLKDTAVLLGLSRWTRWRTLVLPALFPYIITGAVTAGGGAWNASIVSEYVNFAGRNISTVGIGAIIAQATARGDYPLLLAGTMSMVVTVVLFNRLVWRRLYRLAEEKFRME